MTDANRIISDGGIASTHPVVPQHDVLAGPATGNEFNAIRAGILPVACWRVEDFRFAFDSSFIKPETKAELKHLGQLLEQHPPASKSRSNAGFPLSVFGHADPTGNDDYNKALSGRRATAMYALLTRRADLWEKLFSHPAGNDNWGKPSLRSMLDEVAPPASDQVVDQHARDVSKRQQLFLAYMEKLCGPAVKVAKEDFLGHGDDAAGKADFQGCSEFNPVTIVSQKDQNRFARVENKAARDEANALNRRVMILIFRRGTRVDPQRWPCPRVSEGVAACRKRFWSDGEARRSTRLPNEARQFELTKDTFACRFYSRLVDRSPCELSVKTFSIRLYNPLGRAIPFAPCAVTIGDREPFHETADARGVITLRDVETPAACVLEWGYKPDDGKGPELIFRLDMFLKADDADDVESPEEAIKKLNNLGYNKPSRADNVRGFQLEYRTVSNPPLSVTGELDAATLKTIREVYRQRGDDLRTTPVQ